MQINMIFFVYNDKCKFAPIEKQYHHNDII